MRRSQTSRPSNAASPIFLERNRSLILTTFMIVLFIAVFVTLFTAPTFRAMAYIVPSPESDPAVRRSRLLLPTVLAKVRGDDSFRPNVRLLSPVWEGNRLVAAVESDNPEQAMFLANRWADAYQEEVSANEKGVPTITLADLPVRPRPS